MDNKHENKFGSGFLWGAIIGGTLVLLVSTKKGRKVLRELADVGLDTIENAAQVGNLEEMEEEMVGENIAQERHESPEAEVSNQPQETSPSSEGNGHSSIKRIFKGVKKK